MRAVPHGKEGKVEVIDRKTITAVIFCGLILKNVHCMAWSVSSILQCGGKGEVIDSRTITEDEERAIWSSKQILRPLLRHGWLKTWKRWQTNLLKKRDFLDCSRDWLCYWRPRKRWQSWFDKKSCRVFCTICYKRFPHSLKILSHGPLAFTKGTEIFTLFVSKDLPVIKVFCLPWAWKE